MFTLVLMDEHETRIEEGISFMEAVALINELDHIGPRTNHFTPDWEWLGASWTGSHLRALLTK